MSHRPRITEDRDPPPGTEGLRGRAGLPWWIVCERTGGWAAALRCESASAGIRIHETRGLGECWGLLGVRPASFVVAELTAQNASALLERLAARERDFPLARVAIVAGRRMAAYEGLMREAGAVWFSVSPREVGAIASLARRHLEAAPTPPWTVAERIWANLPWGREE